MSDAQSPANVEQEVLAEIMTLYQKAIAIRNSPATDTDTLSKQLIELEQMAPSIQLLIKQAQWLSEQGLTHGMFTLDAAFKAINETYQLTQKRLGQSFGNIEIKVRGGSAGTNPSGFYSELKKQRDIVRGTVRDEEYTFPSTSGVSHSIAEFAFMLISLAPTALPQLTSFLNTYMTTHSSEKIVFDAEKKGKKVHIELPAGLNEDQIREKLAPLTEAFDKL